MRHFKKIYTGLLVFAIFLGWMYIARAAETQLKPAGQGEGVIEKNITPYVSFKHQDRVDQVLFMPDGLRILSESWKDGLKISEIINGKTLNNLSFRGYSINSMTLSRDGRYLAVGTNTGKVELWDMQSLTRQKIFPVTQWSIYAAALSDDGKLLGSCAADGTST